VFSLVIPVYANQENLPRLLRALVELDARFPSSLEVIFVVDGSPDASHEILREQLPRSTLTSRLVALSRNFGSFRAIAAGLAQGEGERFGVMAADLQEPPELMLEFEGILASGEADIVMGYRAHRDDPWLSRMLSEAFWALYRRFVVGDIPRGGVDVFGCTREVRDRLLELREFNTNLIALLFWLGFRRRFVRYERRARAEGRSAWSFARKLDPAVQSRTACREVSGSSPVDIGVIQGTAALYEDYRAASNPVHGREGRSRR
jgi:glycosyltransferase involved in cell wall biosynthesis